MGDNIVSKPFGLVLIITAHMVFNGSSRAEVTGILGTNITLQFSFKISVTKNRNFAVYTTNDTKIAGYKQGKSSSREADFNVYPRNRSVFFHITNLKLNHSGIYWAILFSDSNELPQKSNNMVQLIVREENRSSTVPPMQNDITTNKNSGSLFSPHIVTVLVVSPVVLLAAVLPLMIWCLVRTKDKQQQPPQHGSNPTVQETVDASNNVPAPPLVYSVLDFPKRPSAVLEMDPNGTEYAAVSYLTEKRQG